MYEFLTSNSLSMIVELLGGEKYYLVNRDSISYPELERIIVSVRSFHLYIDIYLNCCQ